MKLTPEQEEFMWNYCLIDEPTNEQLDEMYAEESQRMHKRARRPAVDFDRFEKYLEK